MPYPHNSRFAGTRPRRSTPAGPAFPVRREVPVGVIPSVDPADAAALCREATAVYAASDPIGCLRTVAAALRPQTSGAKEMAVRALIAALAQHEPPTFLDAIAAEICRLASLPPAYERKI